MEKASQSRLSSLTSSSRQDFPLERATGSQASADPFPFAERICYWWIADDRSSATLQLRFIPTGAHEGENAGLAQIHPADTEHVRLSFAQHEAEHSPARIACRIRSGDTPYRWMLLHGQPSEGVPFRVLGRLYDIEEQKRLEERCSAMEERCRDLFESSIDLSFTTDLQGRFREFNHAAEKLTGYSREEAQGRSLFELVPQDVRVRFQQQAYAVLGGSNLRQTEWMLVTRSGDQVPVELSLRLTFRSGRPSGLLGTARDISERKRLETALRGLSGRLLTARDEEQRRLARDLHDATAQELAAITMNLGMLIESGKTLDRESQEIVRESLELARQCVREVRTISYLLHPPMLDEAGLNSALHWFCQGFSARSGIQVRLDIPQNFGRLPGAIETAFFRIVQEALTNIHRHSESQTARLRLQRRQQCVVLTIADRGKGLSKDQLKAFRAGVGAVGVGLAGMRERMRQLGGTFSIRSQGVGTVIQAVAPCTEEIHDE